MNGEEDAQRLGAAIRRRLWPSRHRVPAQDSHRQETERWLNCHRASWRWKVREGRGDPRVGTGGIPLGGDNVRGAQCSGWSGEGGT